MVPTRAGRVVLGLALLSWLAATASGNNLLYFLYSLLLAGTVVGAVALALNLRRVSVSAGFPDQVFRGTPTLLTVRLRNSGSLPAHGLGVRWGSAAAEVERLDPGAEAALTLRAELPHRGMNRLEGLTLESVFPLGLLRRRIEVRAGGLAFPRPREVRSARELDVSLSESGSLKPRRGGGDEFYGIRQYDPADDSRTINWKLTARSGRLLVNEFAAPVGDRVTVRVDSTGGEAGEKLISEAASACRHYTDKGTLIRLLTPEGKVDYGKGLLHLDRLLAALALLGPGKTPRPAPPPAAERPEEKVPRPLLAWNCAGAALVVASLPLIEEIQPWLLLCAAAVVAGAWAADLSPWSGRLSRLRPPELFWRPASLLMLAYVLLIGWRRWGVTLATTHLLLFLMANLLLKEKSARENGQLFLVLFLAFFLISGQTISLWYFAAFLLYAVFSAAWLGLAAGLKPRAGPLAAVLGATLAGAAAFFAVTPRIEPHRRMRSFVAMGLDKRAPGRDFVTGFTEDVSLGFFGRLKKSSARVLRMRPVSPAGYRGPVLVRGCAFDSFDGRQWSKDRLDFRYDVRGAPYRTMKGRAWTPRRAGELVFPGGPGAGPGATVVEFTLLPLNSSVLFSVDGVGSVDLPDNAAWFDYTDTVYFSAPHLSGVRYRVRSPDPPTVGFAAHVEAHEELLRGRYLQLPPDLDPRVLELARSAAGGAKDARGKISGVVRLLRRDYEYRLYSDDASRDLEGFLLRAPAGNCEYFASAAAVLLRASGVPSRLVAGFLAQEWNEYGEFYDVRQGEAHAWVEAWVEGEGWVAVDATPERSELSIRSGALAAKARRWFEAMQARWYRDVIGYDKFVQRNTFHRFQLGLRTETAAKAARLTLTALLSLGAAAALAWGLRALLRRPRRRGPWARAAEALERAGMRREDWQTPREFAAAVLRSRPGLPALGPLAEAHYELKYSDTPGPGTLGEAERLADEVLEALKRDGAAREARP